jgi:hypothetical protein
MKIEIVQCTRPEAWYKDKIGEEFELDYVSLNDDTQNYDAFLTYNKTNGSRYFVFHGDYEFVSDDISLLNLFKRIEKLEQQVKELQNRRPQYIPYPVYPNYPPYIPMSQSLKDAINKIYEEMKEAK